MDAPGINRKKDMSKIKELAKVKGALLLVVVLVHALTRSMLAVAFM